MGRESQIEPWLPTENHFCLLVSEDWLRREEAMKTAGRENQTRHATARERPELTERKSRTILLNEVGWTARKTPATGEVFFLDSLYRTNRDLDRLLHCHCWTGTVTPYSWRQPLPRGVWFVAVPNSAFVGSKTLRLIRPVSNFGPEGVNMFPRQLRTQLFTFPGSKMPT